MLSEGFLSILQPIVTNIQVLVAAQTLPLVGHTVMSKKTGRDEALAGPEDAHPTKGQTHYANHTHISLSWVQPTESELSTLKERKF